MRIDLQNPHDLPAHHTSAEENNLLHLRRTSNSVAPRLMILRPCHSPYKQIPIRLWRGTRKGAERSNAATENRQPARPWKKWAEGRKWSREKSSDT